MNKKILIILAIVVFILGGFFFLYSCTIFQEGNPWPQIKGITQLTFGNSDIVKLSGSDDRYMTKSKNGQEAVENLMKNRGYEFVEQMGSGYFFKSSTEKRIVVIHEYYTRYYSLWDIVETKENSLAEELRDCLPKSGTASHEKCTELLKQITDFDSCVAAGFSIMKSIPLQCATPDGRTFIQ
ncbi:MAG TPA: hypothetical protein PLQ44_00090 [Candidatus Paceibacterota bacterium]|nr:hypothetical protein [Candidatus Paceibacterota bacterium]HPT40003.1 hypothetical protein [Candidatus Paceibacterota bacterium]